MTRSAYALQLALILVFGSIAVGGLREVINLKNTISEVPHEQIKKTRQLEDSVRYALNLSDATAEELAALKKQLDIATGDFTRLGASLAIETPVALFETSLANPISSSASTMTLNSATTKDGSTLASSTYSFIIDEGTTNEEFVKADCTSTACTNMTRGISALTGTSTVAALQKAHRRGASVKITDAPLLVNITRILNGIGTVPNILSYTSHPTLTVGTQLVDKTYADALAFAGVATSSESNFGGVWLGTALQQASSTNGGANQPYVMQTRYATDTPTYGCAVGYTGTAGAGCTVIARLNGKISQSFLNLAESYAWTGTHTHSGTSTFNSGVDIDADANSPLILNGVSHELPSAGIASSTTWAFDANGKATYWPLTMYKNGVTSTSTDPSGPQVIPHGLGRTPRNITITTTNDSGAGSPYHSQCRGTYNGVTQGSICTQWTEVAAFVSAGTSGSISTMYSAAAFNTTAVASFDATNITLTWTPNGGAGNQTIHILWEAE